MSQRHRDSCAQSRVSVHSGRIGTSNPDGSSLVLAQCHRVTGHGLAEVSTLPALRRLNLTRCTTLLRGDQRCLLRRCLQRLAGRVCVAGVPGYTGSG